MEEMGKPQSSPPTCTHRKTACCVSLCRIMKFGQHSVGDWVRLGTIREGFLKERGHLSLTHNGPNAGTDTVLL